MIFRTFIIWHYYSLVNAFDTCNFLNIAYQDCYWSNQKSTSSSANTLYHYSSLVGRFQFAISCDTWFWISRSYCSCALYSIVSIYDTGFFTRSVFSGNLSSALKKDKTIPGYAEQLRGLTDMDLQAINFNNGNLEKGEDALRTLKEALDLTEEQLPILINAFLTSANHRQKFSFSG